MAEGLPQKGGPDPRVLATLADALEARLAHRPGLLVAGICGSQASGKSTLAGALAARFTDAGVPAASLSLDDLYLARARWQRASTRCSPRAARPAPTTWAWALP